MQEKEEKEAESQDMETFAETFAAYIGLQIPQTFDHHQPSKPSPDLSRLAQASTGPQASACGHVR